MLNIAIVNLHNGRNQSCYIVMLAAGKLCKSNMEHCVQELERMRRANPHLRIEIATHVAYPEFVQLLRRTKIFVSPLG